MHNRRLLRSLGFLTASGADVPVDEPTAEDPADDDPDAGTVAQSAAAAEA